MPQDADNPHRPTSKRLVASLAVVAVLVLADQLTKWWAKDSLAGKPIHIFGNFFQFELTFNSGAAFGLLKGNAAPLAIVSIVVAVVLVMSILREKASWARWGLVLVLAGAVGNMIDRIFRGESIFDGQVVDFIRLGPIPNFNIADTCITIGVILLITTAIVDEVRKKASHG